MKGKHHLVNPREFATHVARQWTFGIGAVAVVLGIGMAGYHFIGNLSWIDSLVNASMILSGEGPVDKMTTDAGKIFASFYALFSGVFFIVMIGVMLSPFAHRLLHLFHLERENSDD